MTRALRTTTTRIIIFHVHYGANASALGSVTRAAPRRRQLAPQRCGAARVGALGVGDDDATATTLPPAGDADVQWLLLPLLLTTAAQLPHGPEPCGRAAARAAHAAAAACGTRHKQAEGGRGGGSGGSRRRRRRRQGLGQAARARAAPSTLGRAPRVDRAAQQGVVVDAACLLVLQQRLLLHLHRLLLLLLPPQRRDQITRRRRLQVQALHDEARARAR